MAFLIRLLRPTRHKVSLGEFNLIEKYFTANDSGEGIALGIGDDCALINIPLNTSLAVTTDTLNEGIHFFKDTPSYIKFFENNSGLNVKVIITSLFGSERRKKLGHPNCFQMIEMIKRTWVRSYFPF